VTARSLFHPGELVLVVDDEPAIVELLAIQLRRLGCSVATATSVADAIEQLEHAPVDAIVSDYSMPGQTGLNLLAYVQARGLDARFVLCSAALPAAAAAKATARGAAVADKSELLGLLTAA
jgi:CheY-like chemotaxis protein